MNATTIAGIGAGVAGIGLGVALHVRGRSQVEARAADARAEWNEWKGALDREFPDRSLRGDADEQRFERFLADHPAPGWIRTEHKDLRRISIDPFDPVSMPDAIGGGAAAAAIGAGTLLGLGGAALRYARGASPALQAVGAAGQVGGALLAGTLIASSFLMPKDSLVQEIEASEWHRPSKWYH